jgi:mono/diheme cytochrome c family protein
MVESLLRVAWNSRRRTHTCRAALERPLLPVGGVGTVALVVLSIVTGATALSARAQSGGQAAKSTLKLDTGKQIYEAGCVSCHGPDGKGQSQNLAGFERPETFPDFTDCPTSTPEPDVQWRAIITNGGSARAFSQIMPSFKDLLTPEQIDKVLEHLRGLCVERAWPRGDLNLPRPMVTEKAFPENETVIAGSINARGTPGVASTLVYEHRIGPSAMIEAVVPFDFTNDGTSWGSAFGDLALGYKRALFHSLRKGSIFSLGGELSVPTGNATLGTGGESTVFEAFGAFGQLLPHDSFVQVHTGVELPAHPDEVPRAYYLRTAVGKTFSSDAGLGRRWSPMVEFIADRDLVRGAVTNWDIVPEVQIPLSRRMHILGSIGFRIPANNTAGRQKQVLFYALWDWVDGGLLQGW